MNGIPSVWKVDNTRNRGGNCTGNRKMIREDTRCTSMKIYITDALGVEEIQPEMVSIDQIQTIAKVLFEDSIKEVTI